MSYNLDRIRNALNKQPAVATNGKQFKQTKYFKPGIGKYDLRFMPYLSIEGEPVQEVLYYNNLTEDNKRFVAPQSFGLPDPIRDLFNEKRREKNGWAIAKFLKPKKRYYAVVIDRKDEAAGPQIWEFSEEIRDSLYAVMVSADNSDEYLFDAEKGYDWELTVTQALDTNNKPRVFNGNVVKNFTLNMRKRTSPLHKDRAQAQKWIDEMPKLDVMYKHMCKTPEELIEILENFVARLETQGEQKKEEGTDHTASKAASSHTPPTPSDEEVDEKLNEAFGGM